MMATADMGAKAQTEAAKRKPPARRDTDCEAFVLHPMIRDRIDGEF